MGLKRKTGSQSQAIKRKPLAKLSDNTQVAPSRKSKVKSNARTRKNLEKAPLQKINEVDKYVQVKRTKETFKAITKDDGRIIFFTEENSKIIPFDGRKHMLVDNVDTEILKKNETASENEEESFDTPSESCSDEDKDESENDARDKKSTNEGTDDSMHDRRKRVQRAKPQSYREVSSGEEEDEDEDEEDEDEDEDADEDADKDADKDEATSEMEAEENSPASAFSKSGYATGLEEMGGDWRVHGAIDY